MDNQCLTNNLCKQPSVLHMQCRMKSTHKACSSSFKWKTMWKKQWLQPLQQQQQQLPQLHRLKLIVCVFTDAHLDISPKIILNWFLILFWIDSYKNFLQVSHKTKSIYHATYWPLYIKDLYPIISLRPINLLFCYVEFVLEHSPSVPVRSPPFYHILSYYPILLRPFSSHPCPCYVSVISVSSFQPSTLGSDPF